ncbi:MAG: HlyC/CorC family transporter [Clostridia bacterium]|nr:HlyC/CorC family transporter [Clostridia bacterium]
MDSDSWVKLAIYVCFLFGAAYCAAAESAFSGMNKIRVKNLAEDGDRKAKKAMGISADFDKAITALLIGTNVMHIGCASLSTVIGIDLWGEVYGQGTATTIATVVTTIVVYFASELVPKCLAKANSEKFACALAPSLRFLMTVLTPFVWFFSSISNLLVRLFPKNEEPTYTEEELVTIIETGEEEGVLDEEKSELLQSAMEFSETAVSDVMTVKEDVELIDISLAEAEMLDIVRKTRHSRLPLYEGSPDNIVGVLPIRPFLKNYINKETSDIRTLMYQPLVVAPSTPVRELFDTMRIAKIYMAVIKDEEGVLLGIATIEDFVEEIVGEIWDEDDVVDRNFIKLGGYNYDVNARLTVGDTFNRLGRQVEDKRIMSKTLNTWMIENLGHVPEEDECFEYGDLVFEATDVDDDGRVIRITVSIKDEDDQAEAESVAEAEEVSK